MARKYKTRFTLIELLVVIVIISILASLLLPILNTAKEKARRAVCVTNIKQTTTAIILYANDKRKWLPPQQLELTPANYFEYTHWGRWFETVHGRHNLGHLYSDYLNTGEGLYCPSQPKFGFQYKTYTPWPSFYGIGIRSAYTFNPRLNNAAGSSSLESPDHYRRYPHLRGVKSDAVLLMDLLEGQSKTAHGPQSGSTVGWNVGRFDSSVSFRVNPTTYYVDLVEHSFMNVNFIAYDRALSNIADLP